jgi:hypothetical protein
VVILARQAIDHIAGAETVCVSGAYEAAAELLAAREAGAGRLALVVDLGLLWPRHLGLLEVARKLDAEMLAFGTAVAGLDAEQLAGLRLVSRAALAEALAQFAQGQDDSGREDELARPEDLTPIEEPLRSEESLRAEERFEPEEALGAEESILPKPAVAARLVPAKEPRSQEDETQVEPPSLDLTLESGDGEGVISSRPPAGRAAQPGSLLTPEELSALLGEEGQ